jgi:biopolymer transport protein ExbB
LRPLSLRVFAAAALLACSSFFLSPVSAQAPAAPAASAAPAAATPAPAAVTAPAAAAAPKKNGEALDNPYGIEALWKGSDIVARSVPGPARHHERGQLVHPGGQADRADQDDAPGAHRRCALLGRQDRAATAPAHWRKNSAYRFIAEAGAQATTDHGGLKSHIPMNEWIPMSITAAGGPRSCRPRKAAWPFLATVGPTSPFVGLFGTVWGIYHALTAIGISGQASIDKVAGPVGEALIMTALGLAVAIPAVLAYNWLARRNKAVMDEVREFADELNAVIVGSAGKAA